jgi:hypothetical protein
MQFTYIGSQSKKDVRVASSIANGAFVTANSASSFANGAFNAANSASSYANGAFALANSSFAAANSASLYANGAFGAVNSVSTYANSAYATANLAYNHANASFTTANLKFNTSGGTISGDVSITGNLSVLGNTFSTSATQIVANDTLFIMGTGNYTGDILDIGFAAHYNNGTNAHTGLIRDAGTKEWQLFEEYTPEIGGDNNININDASFKIATLNANVKSTTITIKGIDVLPYVNSAFAAANSTGTYANGAFDAANSASLYANAAFAAANSGSSSSFAFNQANAAFAQANAAFAAANTGGGGGSNTAITIQTNKFVANGSTSTFNLSVSPLTEDFVTAVVDGIVQLRDTYTISGNVIYFDTTFENGANVEVTTLSGNSYISAGSSDTYARDTANAAFIQANAAFTQANTGGTSLSKAIAMSIVFGF